MTGIAIYLEGGGDGNKTRRGLRRGMNQFLAPLKDEARRRRMLWTLIPCGDRARAFSRWSRDPEDSRYPVRILLVDAEAPVQGSPADHLRRRDGWEIGRGHHDKVHLMAQTMETWLVGDSASLEAYYGARFNRAALPVTPDLESVPKKQIEDALRKSTARTQKGEYHKTRHAPDLLERISSDLVRRRCGMCERLFTTWSALIEA